MVYKSEFCIVAIGLSAGGQQPLWDFFSQIPSQSGIAFIVIQHLDRNFISIADKLLAKHAAMPVKWATHQQQVEPNCAYMLPINKMMTIERGFLQLQDRNPQNPMNRAVDIFFHSLANSEKSYAIGIILSGAGSDGTLGAIHIHAEGGKVMVQDPQTAQFASMPRSAILKNDPIQILSPTRLAKALVEFVASKG